MAQEILIIGTRGSRLALAQANRVRGQLAGPSEIQVIRTSGDRFKETPLHEQEGVGFFTKEIESSLLEGKIDLAVHSLKDLPTLLAAGLTLAAVLKRDDPGDLLLLKPEALDESRAFPLKAGAGVGGSSLRRQALLQSLRDDLVPVPLRGNVPTRIEKTLRGDCDAIVIARAGMARLGLDVAPLLAYDLNPRLWICAPGQGAIAVEACERTGEVHGRLGALDHARTRSCVLAERALLISFGGGCHAPFGAWATAVEDGYQLFVGAPGTDGVFRVGGFMGAELSLVQQEAEAWIKAGRPETARQEAVGEARPGSSDEIVNHVTSVLDAKPISAYLEEGEWICRPARPWS